MCWNPLFLYTCCLCTHVARPRPAYANLSCRISDSRVGLFLSFLSVCVFLELLYVWVFLSVSATPFKRFESSIYQSPCIKPLRVFLYIGIRTGRHNFDNWCSNGVLCQGVRERLCIAIFLWALLSWLGCESQFLGSFTLLSLFPCLLVLRVIHSGFFFLLVFFVFLWCNAVFY